MVCVCVMSVVWVGVYVVNVCGVFMCCVCVCGHMNVSQCMWCCVYVVCVCGIWVVCVCVFAVYVCGVGVCVRVCVNTRANHFDLSSS